jgi:hypothetical protein
MIKQEEADAAESQFDTNEKAQAMWDAFKKDEPVLYSRMLNHARSITTELQKKQNIPAPTLALIHNGICAGYMLAFSIIKKRRDDIFDKVSKEDAFTMFLNGKAPRKFYNYSLENVPPDSDLFKAMQAHEKNSLAEIRSALLPILAEDIGDGQASRDLLMKVEDNLHGR